MAIKIKEILTIDLNVDIKNVIDLEDIKESEIQSEIENYIITDGLAKDFESFISTFLLSKSGTGVWISGFYGSGKSYFGKILGYMLNNATICGTPARERILQRFTGIKNESLVKNTIARLNTLSCRVVFLDIAKQSSSSDDKKKNLSYILFMNFLKSLEIPSNEHGLLLYHLLINQQATDIHDYIYQNTKKDWSVIKSKLLEYTSVIKDLFLRNDPQNSEEDYQNIMQTIRRDLDQFSSSRLKEELSSYLKLHNTERVVFLFDEASEAITQGKINLLDLEGVSESLSALGGQVWTIAIAQEKLDDVINNARVNKAQLTKVTDRFQTKIHLEATEVDEIIRQRLLQKNEKGLALLQEYYQKNSGKIANHALLIGKGILKTDNLESYVTYYPFYRYQFDLMQNFLFGTKGLTSTKVAARGMIITTYDILKKELQEQPIFNTATGWQIATQAQPQPPVRLVNRYENAERILSVEGRSISGRELLKTIHFLTESETVNITNQNIVKSMSDSIDNHSNMQKEIELSLQDLVDSKTLLCTNQQYRITSDLEEQFIQIMTNFIVPGYMKKKRLIDALKNSHFLRSISKLPDGTNFAISSDNSDDLANPSEKFLFVKVMSLYDMSDDKQNDIERLKTEYQNNKETLWIIPENKEFEEVNKLVDSLERLKYLLEKYPNPQGDEKTILQGFQTEQLEKENQLKALVEQSFNQATVAYLYNVTILDSDSAVATIQKIQNQIVKNVYSKRPLSLLSDDLAARIITEKMDSRLAGYFSGSDYQFFNKQGIFIGDNLLVVGEIVELTKQFSDGKTLETELAQPPTGFSFGTVKTTVAVLLRTGKMIMKYNGQEIYDWNHPVMKEVMETSNKFRSASFKSTRNGPPPESIKVAVTHLLELKINDFIEKKIDWNANKFDVAFAIRNLTKYFIDLIESNRKRLPHFDDLFVSIRQEVEILSQFTGTVDEATITERIQNFIQEFEKVKTAISNIQESDRFIQHNLSKVQKWFYFIKEVLDELKKSLIENQNIQEQSQEFFGLYQQNIVGKYKACEKIAQSVQDAYYQLMKEKMTELNLKYQPFIKQIEETVNHIQQNKSGNEDLLLRANALLTYAKDRVLPGIEIQFSIQDRVSHFSLSDLVSSIALYTSKETELLIIKSSINTSPPEEEPGLKPPTKQKRVIKKVLIQQKRLSVEEYRKWLHHELQTLSNLNPDDEIEMGAS